MIDLYYNPRDPRYIFLTHDSQKTTIRTLGKDRKYHEKEVLEIVALEEHLNRIPDYQYMASFAGIPKPVVFLEKQRVNDRIVYYCLTGLWHEIKTWCAERNITCRGIFNLKDYDNPDKEKDPSIILTPFNMGLEEFQSMVEGWGLNLELRGYQYEAPWKILHYHQSMSELATRSGKTLMAYVIFRYMLEHGGAHNILMVVPSISLVKQGVNDMNEYQPYFTSESIWAKGEYCEGANLTIGTFQSLVKRCCKGRRGQINKHYDPKFFDKFDVICIDECHKADCESIKQIMAQPFIKNAKLVFGFSGTLPDNNTIESYACQALLGPCIQKIETMELVNAGYLAKPIITQIRINYTEDLTDQYIKYGEYLCSNFVTENGKHILRAKEDRDMTMIHVKKPPIVLQQMMDNVEMGLLPKASYAANIIDMCKAQGSNLLVLEQMIAEHSTKKLEIMKEITFEWSHSNGIIFAHNEAYVDHLEKFFKEQYPNRAVYKIKGSTAQKKRDKIKEAMNTTDTDAILIASYGVVSTGLTFKNIDYAVFAQSFKSKIINGQSLGRGLLLAEGKTTFHLYDIVDVFPTERLKKQGESKTKMYREKNFEYKIVHR